MTKQLPWNETKYPIKDKNGYWQPRILQDPARLKFVSERIPGVYLKPNDIGKLSSSKILLVKNYAKQNYFDDKGNRIGSGVKLGHIEVHHDTVADDDAHKCDGFLLSLGPTAFRKGLWEGCDPNFYIPGQHITFTKSFGQDVVINGVKCYVTFDDDIHMAVGPTATVESFLANMGKRLDPDNLADNVILTDPNCFEGLD